MVLQDCHTRWVIDKRGRVGSWRRRRGAAGRRSGQYLAVSSLDATLHCFPTKVSQQVSKFTNLVGPVFEASLAEASVVGRWWSACCTYTGYNEMSVEARYGVMRSAKRTQTYWRAGVEAADAGRGGGAAIGSPGHASDDAGADVASPHRTPLHNYVQLPDSHFSTISTRVNLRLSTLKHVRDFNS